jgi:spermidine/putrescine transport system permease protein
VVITIRARLEGMDLHIEEAAMDLGASQLTTIRKITLPLIMPGIVAAGLLAFAISIDDFVVTNFTAGPYQTFPLFVYGAAKQGVPPQVNVLATALLIVALLGMFANLWYQRRAARRDARAMPEGAGAQAA